MNLVPDFLFTEPTPDEIDSVALAVEKTLFSSQSIPKFYTFLRKQENFYNRMLDFASTFVRGVLELHKKTYPFSNISGGLPTAEEMEGIDMEKVKGLMLSS